MLNFSNEDHLAQVIGLHYAVQLNNSYAQQVFGLKAYIKTPAEAEAITLFFWSMVDCAVEDEEQGKEIEGTVDLQLWMERLMNILMGYINRIGFGDVWAKTSDAANGR